MSNSSTKQKPPDKVVGDFLSLPTPEQLWVARQVIPALLQHLNDAQAAGFLQEILANSGKEKLATWGSTS